MGMPLVCFATGNFWRFANRKDFFERIRQFGFEGIELTLGKRFGERETPVKNFKWIKKKRYVSIHSPFKMVRIVESEEELLLMFRKIKQDYASANAKSLIVHPYEMPSEKILKKIGMNIVTENMENRKWQNRLSFERVLKKYPSVGLCLDVSHAYSWSPNETARIIKKWKPQIRQVHFSNCRYKKCHVGFAKVSEKFIKSIMPLKELDVPIVIEEDMRSFGIESTKKELLKIKEILEKVYSKN
ncbi:MAG: hypothetical protein WC308_03955 [archaeon]|jgi:sugar phosphate isomerase/epimerase